MVKLELDSHCGGAAAREETASLLMLVRAELGFEGKRGNKDEVDSLVISAAFSSIFDFRMGRLFCSKL